MRRADIVVDHDDLGPDDIVLTQAAARQIGGGTPVNAGDRVATPAGLRIVVKVVQGAEARAWAQGASSTSWALEVQQRAADGLRRFSTAVDEPDAYHPIHHTPLGGFPVQDAHLEWLESKGGWHVRDEIGWRQDHRALAARARDRRRIGRRVGAAWREVEANPALGLGRIRDGLQALMRVLGFELTVQPDGVRIGLWHRGDAEQWSAGKLTSSGAYRHGEPIPGGAHDPELVGTSDAPRQAHIALPCVVLPRHLEGWVAGLLERDLIDVREMVREGAVRSLQDELQYALDHRYPRPSALDGTPLQPADFLWTEVPVAPAAYRQRQGDGERHLPHGLDGPLHGLMGTVRKLDKIGGLEALPEHLRAEIRGTVADAVDLHLGWAMQAPPNAWGWSVASDIQETLRMDGVMLDWGGVGIALVDPGRTAVGLPRSLCKLLLDTQAPEAVALTHLPEGVVVVRPQPVDGPALLLPPQVADALHVRSGGAVRVLPAVGHLAQAELEAIGRGLRLAPPPRGHGWLDAAAAADPEALLVQLAAWARAHAHDSCLGAVGRRTFGGVVAPPVGTPGDEVRGVQRGLHALAKVLGELEPQTRLGRGLSAGRFVGRTDLRAEVRALYVAHDGQAEGGEPLWQIGRDRWRFVPFSGLTDATVIGEGDRVAPLQVRSDGRVVCGGRIVAGSLSALVHEALLSRLG